MSKHTPGPWVAVARTNAYIDIEAPNQPGYSAKQVASTSLTNHEANARLIAAAPEMLDALRRADAWWGDGKWYGPVTPAWLDEARAAIAKATGETP